MTKQMIKSVVDQLNCPAEEYDPIGLLEIDAEVERINQQKNSRNTEM